MDFVAVFVAVFVVEYSTIIFEFVKKNLFGLFGFSGAKIEFSTG